MWRRLSPLLLCLAASEAPPRAERRLSGNYQEVAKLTASDAAANDQFGTVAIYGDAIAVGASQANTVGSGVAYVFRTSDGGAT